MSTPAGARRTAREWTASLVDPGLPVVAELLTEGVPGPVQAAAAAAGGVATDAVLTEVTWWPGRSLTASWQLTVEGGELAGTDRYVATTQPAPEGALVLGAGDDAVTVWRVPHDPFLPALPAALRPDVAAAVVANLGGHLEEPGTRLRAYRPTRRAVVEVEGQGHRVYLKLVKPRRLRRLHELHHELAAHLPVPEPLGIDTGLGLLVMRHLPGATLREALEDPAARLPDPAVVAGLPGTMPTLARMAPVSSSVETLPRVAELLAALLPMDRDRVARVVDAIGADDVPERVPAHGDYHEAQVLVTDGRVVGLLDVDTVGMARPADDASTMLAHLAVWHTMSGQPGRVAAYATALQEHWDRVVDPVDLRRRVAARILGLAAGPFRVQQEDWPLVVSSRLAQAERWVESAQRISRGTRSKGGTDG